MHLYKERPYIMYKTYDFADVSGGEMKFEGFCIDLLEELANDLGITCYLRQDIQRYIIIW